MSGLEEDKTFVDKLQNLQKKLQKIDWLYWLRAGLITFMIFTAIKIFIN